MRIKIGSCPSGNNRGNLKFLYLVPLCRKHFTPVNLNTAFLNHFVYKEETLSYVLGKTHL